LASETGFWIRSRKYDYRFKDAGDHVILNGAKMWISTAHFVMSVVWAKDENNRIHGVIVERGMEGLQHRDP
jgi:alkylation response protein AidB-like acyl-CoA dehydrogenase